MNGHNNSIEDLQSYVKRLQQTHLNVIARQCEQASEQAAKLQKLDNHRSTSQYITLCNKLVSEIKQYLKVKNESFLPYIDKLNEKESEGHDCSKCTGVGCNLKHATQLAELKQSHAFVKDMLARLQMASLPLYSETMYPDMYRVLRNHMALLENNLADLFLIEETYLIPKVAEAQKNINAHS